MKFIRDLFFGEVTPLIEKGKKCIINESDAYALPTHLDPESKKLSVHLINWTHPRRCLRSVLSFSSKELKGAYLLYFLATILTLTTPFLVNQFVKLIEAGVNHESLTLTLLIATLLGVSGFASGLLLQHYFYRALASYQRVTNAVNQTIFKHGLHLTLKARGKNQIGDVVNYMSSDSDAIADFSFVFADLSMNILTVIGVAISLFYFLGYSAIAALISFLTLIPLTRFIGKRYAALDDEMMAHRDRRVTLMTQALNAIRVVKYFTWEKSVENEVMEIRNSELASRTKLAKAEVIMGLFYLAVSTVVLFITLTTHSLLGQKIDAALIFTCITLFGLIEEPFGALSHLISRLTAGYVGANRIIKFLAEERLDYRSIPKSHEKPIGIKLENLTVSYNEEGPTILDGLNLEVLPGESIAIVGPVGSGKTTLLYALLGEIKTRGKISYSDGGTPTKAFLPQEAYILNTTIAENMLFGEKRSTEEINHALYLSSLDKDLLSFKGGLKTEIGEKGVNLSGGQKQRVGLARAYLSDPDLLLLDDPLSAVDHDTERKLCTRLLFGAWKKKTRIVVTHRLQHLHLFHKIVYLKEGKIISVGTFKDLLTTSLEFKSFYAEHTSPTHEELIDEGPLQSTQLLKSTNEEGESRITEDEDCEKGSVKASIYFDYLTSLGGNNPKRRKFYLALLILGAIFAALAPLLQRSWLTYFSNHTDTFAPLLAIGIYGVIGVTVLSLTLLNNFFWLNRGIKAGKEMHNEMLQSILKTSVRFFDATPTGRIIQRFSRDIESVDVYLQWTFTFAINSILQIVIATSLILFLVPAMGLVILPVLWMYYRLQKAYRSPAREAKRFDSIARSPRYSHFKETLQGLLVIRSYNKEDWFLKNFYERLRKSQQMFYTHYMLNRWFSTRVPLLGGLISTSTVIGITLLAYQQKMGAGTAGLLTLYTLSFWAYLNIAVRVFADIETRMTSIERLKYFAKIPAEPQTKKEAVVVPDSWPACGAIVAKGVAVRYASHLPQVLKGINFEVTPGSRVGIVGRTGSGKSTLFQTLFRFIELEAGEILIDGIDIASVPLIRLRKSIAIIPQDPTLFIGTIRSNLDRYHEYSDDEITTALKHVSLLEMIQALPLGINSPVNEGGHNFSQGQRQLLCLARALLIKAKIIIMDEATASVDVMTDNIIQKVIRQEFIGVTMLIIAHRLETVSDSDQLIEIDQGIARIIRKSDIIFS